MKISDLMLQSGVNFGTSGARGLAEAITDQVAYAYTLAFLKHLQQQGFAFTQVVVGGDLRPSSPRIMQAIGKSIEDFGAQVVNGGFVSSPAVALYGLQNQCPAIMVTGSHIPDDRNGIKFNRPDGEIDKTDELGIKEAMVAMPSDLFEANGSLTHPFTLPSIHVQVEEKYQKRWVDFFGSQALANLKIGVYQHSTVGRDSLVEIFTALGAEVTPLGRSETFIPVDTEAIRPEDVALAQQWCANGDFDALVSADGDCDRPLLSTENGEWIRGDVLGVLCAQYLQADGVATPVSCNSCLEKSESFAGIARTKIGSPFVIAGMAELAQKGYQAVVGYEANGGFLQWSDITMNGKTLEALPTRDPVIACVGALLLARQQNYTLHEVLKSLPARYTASDRLQEFPTELAREYIGKMSHQDIVQDSIAFEKEFGALALEVRSIDYTDGTRFTLSNQDVVHLRPSGNAPELRCYTESSSPAAALALNQDCLEIMATWRQ